MPLKRTRYGNGVADGTVAKLLRLWQHASALLCHAVWIRIATSHNAWMGYEYSLPNLNRPRVIHKHNPHPSKQWGVCDKNTYQLTRRCQEHVQLSPSPTGLTRHYGYKYKHKHHHHGEHYHHQLQHWEQRHLHLVWNQRWPISVTHTVSVTSQRGIEQCDIKKTIWQSRSLVRKTCSLTTLSYPIFVD